MSTLRAIYVIWIREIIKFWREKPRIISAMIQPAVWLFIMGKGLGASFRGPAGIDYATFMFPGVIGMTVLFTSVFSAISVVWDREFGFLKEMLIAPVSRTSIVIGKAFSGSTVALLQGSLVMIFAPLVGVEITISMFIKTLAVMFLFSFTLSTLGLTIAAKIQTMHSFQFIMNFFVMPMYFLSGAVFPIKNSPLWMQKLSAINPLAYGVDALKGILLGSNEFAIWYDVTIVVGTGMLFLTTAVILFNREGQ